MARFLFWAIYSLSFSVSKLLSLAFTAVAAATREFLARRLSATAAVRKGSQGLWRICGGPFRLQVSDQLRHGRDRDLCSPTQMHERKLAIIHQLIEFGHLAVEHAASCFRRHQSAAALIQRQDDVDREIFQMATAALLSKRHPVNKGIQHRGALRYNRSTATLQMKIYDCLFVLLPGRRRRI